MNNIGVNKSAYPCNLISAYAILCLYKLSDTLAASKVKDPGQSQEPSKSAGVPHCKIKCNLIPNLVTAELPLVLVYMYSSFFDHSPARSRRPQSYSAPMLDPVVLV